MNDFSLSSTFPAGTLLMPFNPQHTPPLTPHQSSLELMRSWSDLCGPTLHLVSETSLITEPCVSECRYWSTSILCRHLGRGAGSSACMLPKAIALQMD